MNNKVVAVGDLHGHFDQWIFLYNKLLKHGIDPKEYTFVFLGDYVDGGDQTKQVIDWLIQKQKEYPHWQFLFGNHEDLMLDALSGGKIYGSWDLWWNQGGKQTAYSYYTEVEGQKLTDYEKAIIQPKDYISKEHIEWLKKLKLYYQTDNYFFVHAGLLADMTIEKHIEILKKGDRMADDLISHMIWVREIFYQSNYQWEKKIVFGHTTFKQPLIRKNMIGIDAMFHNQGSLHALILPEEEIISVHSEEV